MLSTNPVELGRPIVTVEPSATPRAANNAASRSTRSTNPARVNVTSPQVSAGRSGISFSQLPENSQEGIPADVAHFMLLPWRSSCLWVLSACMRSRPVRGRCDAACQPRGRGP